MKKPHIIIDVTRCQGCNNCHMACKDEHVGNDWPGYSGPQAPHGESWIKIPVSERGRFPLIDVTYRPTMCTHCADAPCVARSGGAIYKRSDGIVLIDPKKAAGRGDLVSACPYGMITWSEESIAPQKCTMCAHLLDAGWDKPRCVQACGPGALSFVWETEEEFAIRMAAEDIETLRPGAPEDTGVLYRGLERFDSCFIGGSIAVRRGGVLDCAPGATVTLRRTEQTEKNAVLQTAVTDAFGDFKFDGLEPGSGEYEIDVALEGFAPAHTTAVVEKSVTVGTILLEGEDR